MRITSAELARQDGRLSTLARAAIARAARPHPHVDVALLKAVMSRETDMRNIVGDGGHGRGGWQIDDRWHGAWLEQVRGCRSGSSIPVYRSARPAGRVPTISVGARKAAAILEANVEAAIRAGIPDGHRMDVAVAAYNAGMGGALRGWKTDRNPDRFTTGADYSRDVLARARILRGRPA